MRDGALDGGAGVDLGEPAGDMGRIVEVDPGELAPPQSAVVGDVGDAEFAPRDEAAIGQHAIQDIYYPTGFRGEAVDRDRLRLGGQALEETGLAERRAERGGMEEQLLEDARPVRAAFGQQVARLLGEIDEDRGGLGEHEAFAIR